MVEWEYCTLVQDVDKWGKLHGAGRLHYGEGVSSGTLWLPIDLDSCALRLGATGWELTGATRVTMPPMAALPAAYDQIVLTFRRRLRAGLAHAYDDR